MRSDAAPALPATLPALNGSALTNLNGSAIASGTVPAANGGAGAVNGALKANGAGSVSQAACADLSNATASCSTSFTGVTSYTPAITFGGAGVGVTYSVNQGFYDQQGSRVCFNAYIVLSSKGSSTGAATISLPVAKATGYKDTFTSFNQQGLTFTGALQAATASTTAVGIYTNTAGTFASLSDTAFANNTDLGLSGCYFTN